VVVVVSTHAICWDSSIMAANDIIFVCAKVSCSFVIRLTHDVQWSRGVHFGSQFFKVNEVPFSRIYVTDASWVLYNRDRREFSRSRKLTDAMPTCVLSVGGLDGHTSPLIYPSSRFVSVKSTCARSTKTWMKGNRLYIQVSFVIFRHRDEIGFPAHAWDLPQGLYPRQNTRTRSQRTGSASMNPKPSTPIEKRRFTPRPTPNPCAQVSTRFIFIFLKVQTVLFWTHAVSN